MYSKQRVCRILDVIEYIKFVLEAEANTLKRISETLNPNL